MLHKTVRRFYNIFIHTIIVLLNSINYNYNFFNFCTAFQEPSATPVQQVRKVPQLRKVQQVPQVQQVQETHQSIQEGSTPWPLTQSTLPTAYGKNTLDFTSFTANSGSNLDSALQEPSVDHARQVQQVRTDNQVRQYIEQDSNSWPPRAPSQPTCK